jgi:MFS family permease
LYGTAAALIFGPQFFPTFDPVAGVLASFAVFGAGFLARPLGGIVMGHFGDKIGRKSMLVISLLMVGVGTFLIGVLPNFDAIGVWAPILLVTLRLIQGFGVGGEWSGAVLMSVEHAPKGKESLYGVFPQVGIPLGLTIANIAFLIASASGHFAEWVWRVPFLFSGVLIIVGFFVRMSVSESPVFEEIKSENVRRRLPLVDVFKEHPAGILIAAGLPMAPIMITYIFATYGLTYMTSSLGMDKSLALTSVLVGTGFYAIQLPFVGWLCDRVRSPEGVFLAGTAVLGAAAWAYFPLLNTKSPAMMILAAVLMSIGLAATYGPVAVLIARLFPANLRFSGSSVGYQIATLLAGAPAPFVATAIHASGSWAGITVYMLVFVLISLVAALIIKRTNRTKQATAQIADTTLPVLVDGKQL